MKKLRLILSLLIVLALFSGLFVRGLRQNKELTKSEFLFDTLCTITTYSKSDSKAIDKAFDESARIHRLADFFDNQSDVSRINNAKADDAVTIDADVMNMLVTAGEVFQKSNGAFDITVAPVSSLWDFNSENSAPPGDSEIGVLLPLVDFDALTLDVSNMTVAKSFSDMKIDLGGIAKGYAADRAAAVLKKYGVKNALIDFGGNIVVLGKNPNTKDGIWRIGLQTPYAATGDYSEILEISSGAVVTSGTYQRYFEHNGRKYHHIIDPKTGYPSNQDYDGVTVSAESAALSDCLATAVFVMGKDKGTVLAAEYDAQLYFLP